MKNAAKYITIVAFVAAAAMVLVLMLLPGDFFQTKKTKFRQTRYLKPVLQNEDFYPLDNSADLAAVAEIERAKVNLADGEIAVAVLTEDFDKDGGEEQVIAYRNMLQENNPIYITYIDYEEATKLYKRLWSGLGTVARHGTVSLFTQDLTGERDACMILTGMNANGEHTLTAFKLGGLDSSGGLVISRIADIRIDGTISIVEAERTQAYQLGLTSGASFDIKGRGRDTSSSNEFDQIEITYSYNPMLGRYVQKSVNRIPDAQVEVARRGKLLGGSTAEFEQFIGGLWYRMAPDMPAGNSQYIYFDTSGREIIFYDKSTQQVYKWLSSTSTRYGLYISSQNISVTTLRRVMDIELESTDSIRIKVFEDVRMKITLSAPWDGSYRKSTSLKNPEETALAPVSPYIDAEYNGSLGGISFSSNGQYALDVSGKSQTGRYTFFMLEGEEYLELLPDSGEETSPYTVDANAKKTREVYRVGREAAPEEEGGRNLSLRRVRLSASGVQQFHEDTITFKIPEAEE
jgi:hypothetical protein